MPKQLTLEKIGKLAGVSRATVSRVVNDYPHISPEIRERVQRIIDQTGYQPNLAARTLASTRSNIIGLVIPHVMDDIFSDPYYSILIQGIAETCCARDYTLSLFLLHTKEEENRTMQRILGTGFVDGLLLTADPSDSHLSQQIASKGKPFVQIGRPQVDDRISYVDVDNVKGAYNAVTHLIRQGRERIALIGSHANTAGDDRTLGYRKALEEHGIPWRDELVAVGSFSQKWGYQGMWQLLPQQPDAVFAASDLAALGAMQAMREAGVCIPEDIAIVGYDDIAAAQISEPALTTIRQPIRQTGELAAELLIDLAANDSEEVKRIILPTELIVRHSCGALLA